MPVLSSSIVRSFPFSLLKETIMPVIMATAMSDMMPPIASCARNERPYRPNVNKAPRAVQIAAAEITPTQTVRDAEAMC